MRETSASKPLLTHRKRIRRRQNRRRASLPGTAWKIAYLLSMRRPVCRRRDSHAGFRTELENLIGDGKRKGTSGSNREAESIDAPIRVGLLHSSSPPALPTHSELNTDTFAGVVGIEVDSSIGASSPPSSWTRGSWSTPDCRHGPSLAPEHAL